MGILDPDRLQHWLSGTATQRDGEPSHVPPDDAPGPRSSRDDALPLLLDPTGQMVVWRHHSPR